MGQTVMIADRIEGPDDLPQPAEKICSVYERRMALKLSVPVANSLKEGRNVCILWKGNVRLTAYAPEVAVKCSVNTVHCAYRSPAGAEQDLEIIQCPRNRNGARLQLGYRNSGRVP